MAVLFKSFKQLSNENNDIEFLFETKTSFYAHTHPVKKNETLNQHICEVKKCFSKLVKSNQLENIIDGIILQLSFNESSIGNYIKDMFLNTIIFHDFGKSNPNFQVERMKNYSFFTIDTSVKSRKIIRV